MDKQDLVRVAKAQYWCTKYVQTLEVTGSSMNLAWPGMSGSRRFLKKYGVPASYQCAVG